MAQAGRGRCAVCTDPRKTEINELLASGASTRVLAKQFGIGRSSLVRHWANHPDIALVPLAPRPPRAKDRDLKERLEELYDRADAFLTAAEAAESITQGLAAIREARMTLELIAKITLQLDQRPIINIETHPEFVRIQTAMMSALATYPEASADVVAALKGLD